MPCPQSQYTPNYDNAFFDEIARCPRTPQSEYCACYDIAANHSLERAQEQTVIGIRNRQAEIDRQIKQYPRQTEVAGPPLNVPSRADQKRNTYSKTFDPKARKIIVLLIAAVLLFLALVSYD